jgi:opacity protein-like surface antigen
MKTRFVFVLVLLCAAALFLTTSSITVHAQQASQPKAESGSAGGSSAGASKDQLEDPDSRMMRADNYLERFTAVENVERLMKENLEEIYLLKVIVTNFPGEGWKKEYDELYEKYKDGLQNYYKRRVITAQRVLTDNKKQISDLFRKAAEKYRKDAEDMLDVCAKSVLIVSLNKLTRYDPDKNKQLMDNTMRLRVAYGKTDDAYEATVNHKYMYAIYHYRNAKSYAIKIMDDLINEEMIRKDFRDPDEEKVIRDLVSKKNGFDLETHRADNANRIKGEGKQQQQQTK